MPSYKVTIVRSARKELEALDSQIIKRIFPKLEDLAVNPRPSGCAKLQGENVLWRIRVGDYRIVYLINDKKHLIDIIRIRHRKDVYG